MTSFRYILTTAVTSPWICLFASRPIFAYGAGFTSPNSLQRFAVFVILCLYVWITLADFTTYIQSTSYWASIIAASIFTTPLRYFDRVLYRKWPFEERKVIFDIRSDRKTEDDASKVEKATTAIHTEDTYGSRFAFGGDVDGTIRGPGTSWEIKDLPRFSSSDPQWTPSPTLFIAWRLAIMVGCFLLSDYVVNAKETLNKDLLQPSFVPFLARIDEVSCQEVWTRLVVGVTSWATGYCLMQVIFGIPAMIGVCLKPDSVWAWRPVFGSIVDAYTMRGFWGKFWQQNLQLDFRGAARFITYDVLRLPRKGLVQRYTFTFFVFFVSGCLHVISDMGASIPIHDSGALRFFLTQALGIMLEDGAQEIYRRLGGKPDVLSRIAGYLWVVAFLSWSTAVWQYPAILVTKKGDASFGLSSFRSLGPFKMREASKKSPVL